MRNAERNTEDAEKIVSLNMVRILCFGLFFFAMPALAQLPNYLNYPVYNGTDLALNP